MSAPPIRCQWTGEVLEPLRRFRAACDEHLVVGQTYDVQTVEEPDRARRHYFAALRDAWASLPDHWATEFPSVEALRKRALIATGHFDKRRFEASSSTEARKLLTFLRPLDEFAVFRLQGNVIIEQRPRSQSPRAMGKVVFAQSKSDVLEWIADLQADVREASPVAGSSSSPTSPAAPAADPFARVR
jgi:hypothetical protein